MPPTGSSGAAAYFALKLVTTVTTVALLALICWRYVDFISGEAAEGRMRGCGWRHSSIWAYFTLELVICAVHAPVGVSATWYTNQQYFPAPESLDGVLTCLMLMRLYLIVPVLPEISGWRSPSARAAGFFNRVEISDWLALRAILSARPLTCIVALWMITVASFGWAIMTAEYGVCGTLAFAVQCVADHGVISLSDYQTALWLTVMTMLSVGYGDVAAVTTLGKAVSVCAAFTGALLNGMLVATLTGRLSLNDAETRTRNCLEHLTLTAWAERELKWAAGKLVLEALWDNVVRNGGGGHRIGSARAGRRSRAKRSAPTSPARGSANYFVSPMATVGVGAAPDTVFSKRVLQRRLSLPRLDGAINPSHRPFASLPLRLRRAIKHFRGAQAASDRVAYDGHHLLHGSFEARMVELAEDTRRNFDRLDAQLELVLEGQRAAAASGVAPGAVDAAGDGAPAERVHPMAPDVGASDAAPRVLPRARTVALEKNLNVFRALGGVGGDRNVDI